MKTLKALHDRALRHFDYEMVDDLVIDQSDVDITPALPNATARDDDSSVGNIHTDEERELRDENEDVEAGEDAPVEDRSSRLQG